MTAPPADPEPSREPVAWTEEQTVRLLTTYLWTAEELASLFQMQGEAGQAAFFKAFAMLLKEKALTDVAAHKDDRDKLEALVANLETMGALRLEAQRVVLYEEFARLQARNAEPANPAAALSHKRRGTTSTKKPWRKVVLASEKFIREVVDPAVKPAGLARRIEAWLGKLEVKHPLPRAIERWIKELRKRAAPQAQ
jgi:hypothetical protein